MKSVRLVFFLLSLFLLPSFASANACGGKGLWLQVLGSGGPEIDDGRASSSYLVWKDGKARVLIDLGSGSLLNFEKSRASLNDLDVILLTHLHTDHSNDLPALVKSSFFTRRDRDLPIYGPTGNRLMPPMTGFVHSLLGEQGAFRYLSDFLDGTESYRLLPVNVDTSKIEKRDVLNKPGLNISVIPVNHGPVPAIAWRIDLAGKSVVFSGDTSNKNHVLWQLAKQADIFVAHHAIAEQAHPVARNLHMPPSEIGKIANRAKVKKLVLSHRMSRTLGKEKESLSFIRNHYKGPVVFADDLQCFNINK